MADSEISGLTGVGALTGAEIWHVVQSGNSRQLGLAAVITFAATTLQAKSAKGAANGYASLNASGQVPASQLPGGSDVVNYVNLAAFPGTGVVGTIYIADDTDTSYLWDDDANVYVAIASSGTLPSTVGFKVPVRRVATTNVNIATGGIVSVDGANTVNKDRILLAGQTAPAENGIYICNSTGAWTRATDADTVAEIRAALVTVWQGTTYGGSLWFTTFKQGNTLNTTAMNWYRVAHYGNIVTMIDAILGSTAWQTSGGSYTDENAQDAVGATFDSTLVYDDAGNVMKRAPITGHVTIANGSNAAALGSFTKAELVTAVSDGDPLYASDIVGMPFMMTVAVSDETTALTTGTAKVTFRMPHKVTLTDIRASVGTAPTGGTLLTVDVNEGGATILSTKLTFDASEKTTTTAATPRVISDTSLADDAEITIDIDAVGSTIAGAGLKVTFIGTHAA